MSDLKADIMRRAREQAEEEEEERRAAGQPRRPTFDYDDDEALMVDDHAAPTIKVVNDGEAESDGQDEDDRPVCSCYPSPCSRRRLSRLLGGRMMPITLAPRLGIPQRLSWSLRT